MSAYFTRPLSQLTTKWRIFYEESADLGLRDERTDFEDLRGYAGARIYRHGQETLAVCAESQIQVRLRSMPGLVPKTGSVLLFTDALLNTVAEAIRAKHRRQYTPEQLEEQRMRMLEARKSLNQGNKTARESLESPSVGK